MVMRMEYFNKIQCYRPSIEIVDAPVSIDEIALLQDSVDKNMLGRIKFINYSKGTIYLSGYENKFWRIIRQ